MGETFEALKKEASEIKTLEKVCALLEWDMQTNMPAHGAPPRAEQQALVQTLIHEKLCAPALKKNLRSLMKPATMKKLGTKDKAFLGELKRRHERASKIPRALIEEMARLDSIAFQKWTVARKENDFKAFAPYLTQQVDANRKVADYIGYRESPYDALLDYFEPGATASWIDAVFSELKEALISLVKKIGRAPSSPSTAVLKRNFDLEKQWAFGLQVLKKMGFDFEAGRQDKSIHPFTSSCGGKGDVRITTRLNPKYLSPGLFGTLHEGGHALYEQGFDESINTTILGGGASCALHESQARLWENMVGRGLPFWRYWFPRLKRLYPQAFHGVKVHEFHQAINRVFPSYIRVEADEVTYGLHIIIRFEMEKNLIEGRLKVKDLPKKWGAMMKQYLGITPPNDRLGVLQDVHWACGYFGYFPSYALGNLYGAQFFKAASKAIPDLAARTAKGDLSRLLDWLRKNIHCHGKIYSATELVERVTGKALGVDDFMNYLTVKFNGICGF